MRGLVFIFLFIVLVAGGCLVVENIRRDRHRDKQIMVLQAKVDALQLTAREEFEPPVFDGVKVLRPKVMKY